VIGVWDANRLVGSVFESKADQEKALKATVLHTDWLDLDRGTITLASAIANAQARVDLDGDKVAQVYHRLPESLTPISSTMQAMQRAFDAGVPIKTHDCFGLCTGVVISCETGLIKPEASIYHHLTDRFSLKPEECIFVDDMQENVDAARACGWQAEQLSDKNQGGVLIDKIISQIVN